MKRIMNHLVENSNRVFGHASDYVVAAIEDQEIQSRFMRLV
jgi:hypothetical protein